MACLPNLDNYSSCPETKSCYLDGRYFNQVFDKYPGLVREPLIIRFTPHGVETKIPTIARNLKHNSFLRVVIETSSARHDTLAIIDHQTRIAYWFDPFDSSYDEPITKILSQCLGYYVYRLHERAPEVMTPTCDVSGFCTAYGIKCGYDYLKEQPCDLSKIKSFASRVEQEYPNACSKGQKDVCYGWLDDNKNLLLGAGLGAGGAALLGTGGAGIIGGAALGGLLGNSFK